VSSRPTIPALKPVRLTESAVAKLPRLSLFTVLAAYALPGLFARDPWRGDDAIGFGVMWTMAEGSRLDWLLPNVQGIGYHDDGPLMFWLGGILIRLFGALITADEAARLAPLAMMALTAASLWTTTYLLGRRREAQPQPLAFGGQPDPRAYGRALADGGLLITLGTLGLLLRAHETSTEIAALAMFATTALGLALSLERPLTGAIVFGLATAGLVLTHGPSAGAAALVAALLAFCGSRDWRIHAARWWPMALAAVSIPLWIWYRALVGLGSPGVAWLAAWRDGQESGPWFESLGVWTYYLRNLLWFVWPAWPMAIWALWTWRFQRDQPQFVLPLAWLIAAMLYFGLGDSPSDSTMLAAVTPMVLLAAFGLPALRRGAANLIDWFALMTFSIFAVVIWGVWAISMTGWPNNIAANFERVLPGYVSQFSLFSFAVGIVLTLLWAALVRWRLNKSPVVVWKSAVLSAGGVVMVWALFMTLLLPAADYRRSYGPVATAIAAIVPPDQCLRGDPIGLPQRASLAYLGPLHFDADCRFRLAYRDELTVVLPPIEPTVWHEVWRGARPGDRHEQFILYQQISRAPLPPPPETVVDEPDPAAAAARGRAPIRQKP
jgi:4-amino-4-deoxy-L-arabinose transferase-like glycosyltransferase